jgi:CMP-N-acetylneuraminic acid synthetase
MKAMAFIPCRMGSTRIVQKNLRMLGLQTMLNHTVRCANDASLDTYISTDGPWVPAISELISAESTRNTFVIKRSEEQCGPTADISGAVREAIIQNNLDRRYDFVVVLQPAVICRNYRMILQMLDSCARNNCSAVTVAYSHPFIWKQKRTGEVMNTWHPGKYPRSQDADSYFVEINSIQITSIENAMRGVRWDVPIRLHVMPAWTQVCDIDTEEDLMTVRDMWRSLSEMIAGLKIIKEVDAQNILEFQ